MKRIPRIRTLAFERVARPQTRRIKHLEDEVTRRPGAIRSDPRSAERFEIVDAMSEDARPPGFPRSMHYMLGSLHGMHRSLRSLREEPTHPRRRAEPGLVSWIRRRAVALGASSVGFAQVPPHLVFRGKAVCWPQAIVLTMEMAAGAIAKAPHPHCSVEVHRVYRDLGRVANTLARDLRTRGYGAHAGHPLMGLALYPPLARAAGLGWQGLHGLLITPEHGPRVRLAAVFTSIEDLPIPQNPTGHRWIQAFCARCRICVRACPADAIRGRPTRTGPWQRTHIDADRCFPVFETRHGCSVCIRACPFARIAYDRLRGGFLG